MGAWGSGTTPRIPLRIDTAFIGFGYNLGSALPMVISRLGLGHLKSYAKPIFNVTIQGFQSGYNSGVIVCVPSQCLQLG